MKITMEKTVLDYLNSKLCNEITIDVFEVYVSSCVRRIPETKIKQIEYLSDRLNE